LWKSPEDDGLERYLLNLFSRSVLPVSKVRERLAARGADPERTEELIESFSEAGYLDDRAYALLYADSHPDWGRRRIRDELRRRAVEEAFIQDALESVDEEARASALASDWARHDIEERKIVGRLLRRGFAFTLSKKIAKRACEWRDSTVK
jgi:regulatory protein